MYVFSQILHIGKKMQQSSHMFDLPGYRDLQSWRLYEACVGSDLKEKGIELPHFYLEEYLAAELSRMAEDFNFIQLGMFRSDTITGVLSLVAGTLYGIARMALLLVAFTSLRSVPEALYTDSWTRYMANIS